MINIIFLSFEFVFAYYNQHTLKLPDIIRKKQCEFEKSIRKRKTKKLADFGE